MINLQSFFEKNKKKKPYDSWYIIKICWECDLNFLWYQMIKSCEKLPRKAQFCYISTFF